MAVFYGQRTGVTTMRLLVKKLCAILIKFAPTIDNWVDTIPSSTDRATVRAFFVAAQAACLIIQTTPDD